MKHKNLASDPLTGPLRPSIRDLVVDSDTPNQYEVATLWAWLRPWLAKRHDAPVDEPRTDKLPAFGEGDLLPDSSDEPTEHPRTDPPPHQPSPVPAALREIEYQIRNLTPLPYSEFEFLFKVLTEAAPDQHLPPWPSPPRAHDVRVQLASGDTVDVLGHLVPPEPEFDPLDHSEFASGGWEPDRPPLGLRWSIQDGRVRYDVDLSSFGTFPEVPRPHRDILIALLRYATQMLTRQQAADDRAL